MGYSNLGQYDRALLEGMTQLEMIYLTSSLHQYPLERRGSKKLFNYSTKKGPLKLVSYWQSQLKVLSIAKKEKVAVVHFQWFKFYDFDLRLVRRLQKSGCKVVLTAHNKLPHNSGQKYLRIHHKLYHQVDAIIVHVSSTKKELVQEFGLSSDKIRVIPHGLLDSKELDRQEVEAFKKKYLAQLGAPRPMIFAMLGSLSSYKGVDLVIEAWRGLKQKTLAPAILFMAGKTSGEFITAIKSLKDCISIDRYLDANEFQALLEVSDYVILPYREISQSGLLLSCLAAHTKIIVSSHESLTEPFSIGPVGYVLEELSPLAIQEALIKSLESVQTTSEEVWKKIEEHYDWGIISEKTESLYQELIRD